MLMESSSSAVSMSVSNAVILSWAKRRASFSSSTVLGHEKSPFWPHWGASSWYVRSYPGVWICSQIYDNCESNVDIARVGLVGLGCGETAPFAGHYIHGKLVLHTAEKSGFGPGNFSFLYGMVYRFNDNLF